MNRDKLERYLKHYIHVELYDGSCYSGVLNKTGDDIFKNYLELFIPKNCYVLTDLSETVSRSCVFRSSHVKHILTKPVGTVWYGDTKFLKVHGDGSATFIGNKSIKK